MDDQPNKSNDASETPGGVLRPFEPSALEPLPPVQASSVVVPEVGAEPVAEMVEVGADASPPASASTEAWSPDAGAAEAWFGLDDEAAPDAGADGVAADAGPAPRPAPSAPESETNDEAAPKPTGAAPDSPAAGALPAAAANTEAITLPRTPFLIGVGAAALAIVALFLLWRGASGGDDGPTTTEAAQEATETTEPPATDITDDAPLSEPVDDGSAEVIAGLEATVADQEVAISGLQADLAATPPPALRGDEMRRIVVAADASFVSVGSESVAVIGPFGGYAAIDPATNAITAAGQVASGATRVLRTSSAVWITNYADSEIVRIDPTTSTVVTSIPFPGPDGVAKLGGTLAVASFDGGFVAQVDPGAEAITRQVDVGGQPTEVFVTEDESAIWVALFDTGEIVRIDAASFEITNRLTVGSGPVGITSSDGLLWVVNHAEGTVVGVDLATEAVVSNFAVGAGPTAATVFGGALWVTVTDAGDLLQLDAATGETITRTPLGTSNRGGPTGLAVGNDSLWVAMQGERSVVRVTPAEG